MKNKQKILFSLIAILVILVIGFGIYELKNNSRIETSIYSEGSAEKVAEDFVRGSSIKGIEFRLEKDFDNGTFIKFYVIPTGKYEGSLDQVRIFLKKGSSDYEVIGFGTAFPELEEEYPELKGQI